MYEGMNTSFQRQFFPRPLAQPDSKTPRTRPAGKAKTGSDDGGGGSGDDDDDDGGGGGDDGDSDDGSDGSDGSPKTAAWQTRVIAAGVVPAHGSMQQRGIPTRGHAFSAIGHNANS